MFAGLPGRPVRLDELRDGCTTAAARPRPGTRCGRFWCTGAGVEAGVWTIACVGCALPSLVETSRRLRRGLPATLRIPARANRRTPRPRSAVAGMPLAAPADQSNLPPDRREHRNWAATTATNAAPSPAVVDVEAAVLSGFLAELEVVDLTRRRVVARLQSAAHETGALACREMADAPIPRLHLFTSCPPPPPARHPDLVLARAVEAGALTRNEAALIGSTRLEPISLAEVAVLRGQSYRDVRAARIRAERKLSMFLREQDTGSVRHLAHPNHSSTNHRSTNHRRSNHRRSNHARATPAAGTATGTPTSPSGSRRTAPNHSEGRVDVPGEHPHLEEQRRHRPQANSPSRDETARRRSISIRDSAGFSLPRPSDSPTDPPRPSRTSPRAAVTGALAPNRSRRRIRRHRSTDHTATPAMPASGSPPTEPPSTPTCPTLPPYRRAATPGGDRAGGEPTGPRSRPWTWPHRTWPHRSVATADGDHGGGDSAGAALTPRTRCDQRPVATGVAQAVLVLVVLAVVMFGAVASAPAHAQDTEIVLALAQSVDELLNNIRNWIVGILAGLATVFLTIGGARYTMAGGDPGEVERAREALRSAARGYALAALAPLIVEILKGLVGA